MGYSITQKWHRIIEIADDAATRSAVLRMSVHRYNYPGFALLRRLIKLPASGAGVCTLTLRAGSNAKSIKLTIRPDDPGDLASFFENWVELPPPIEKLNAPPQLAVDAGAHVGCFSLLLHSLYPQCRLIAIEPNHANGAILETNLKQNCVDGKAENVALWHEDRHSLFMCEGASNAGFAQEARSGSNETGYPVNGRSLATLLSEESKQLDYLKLDIEGAEYKVLPNLLPILPSHVCIWMELHDVDKHPGWMQNLLRPTTWTGDLTEDNHPHQQWLLYPTQNR